MIYNFILKCWCLLGSEGKYQSHKDIIGEIQIGHLIRLEKHTFSLHGWAIVTKITNSYHGMSWGPDDPCREVTYRKGKMLI